MSYAIPKNVNFPTDTIVHIGNERYRLTRPLEVKIESHEGAWAGVYTSCSLPTGRIISVNNGCYLDESELEESAGSFLPFLFAQQDGPLLEMMIARKVGEKECARSAMKEKKEIEDLFEKVAA